LSLPLAWEIDEVAIYYHLSRPGSFLVSIKRRGFIDKKEALLINFRETITKHRGHNYVRKFTVLVINMSHQSDEI
jgi:hypothetical protein